MFNVYRVQEWVPEKKMIWLKEKQQVWEEKKIEITKIEKVKVCIVIVIVGDNFLINKRFSIINNFHKLSPTGLGAWEKASVEKWMEIVSGN